MEEMIASKGIDRKKYAALLGRFLPMPIETAAQRDAAVKAIEKLISRRDLATPEQDRLLKLLSVLVEKYEEREEPRETEMSPRESLLFFMDQHGLRQRDLLQVFGSRSTVSDVVNGKRGITKDQAKGLAQLFHTSVEHFL
jgi:HTH-type transcriptional regulator/antitoxin HigA